jgi:hypothetical protein
MAACGQSSAHLAQSMQISGSHTGIWAAIERFSWPAVPVGKVPSTGRADTGTASPSPARSRRTNPSPLGGLPLPPGTAGSWVGTMTGASEASAASTAASLRARISGPRLA